MITTQHINRNNQLIGLKFNRLTVIEKMTGKSRFSMFLCKCDCGNTKVLRGFAVRNGHVISCGCAKKDVKSNYSHGMSKNFMYTRWLGIKTRCNNKNDRAYKWYGAKGIKLSKDWQKFENFYRDMYPSYKKGLTIDRIDNSKGYSKDNCKWSNQKEQSRNTSRNIYITHEEKTLIINDWAKLLDIPIKTISARVNRRLPPHLILSKTKLWKRKTFIDSNLSDLNLFV